MLSTHLKDSRRWSDIIRPRAPTRRLYGLARTSRLSTSSYPTPCVASINFRAGHNNLVRLDGLRRTRRILWAAQNRYSVYAIPVATAVISLSGRATRHVPRPPTGSPRLPRPSPASLPPYSWSFAIGCTPTGAP
jgi:hypothetical protein